MREHPPDRLTGFAVVSKERVLTTLSGTGQRMKSAIQAAMPEHVSKFEVKAFDSD